MRAIKPLPYISRSATPYEKECAHWYRQKLVPLIKRRLKTHHLAGFRHDFIVKYVAEQKKNYPFFVRTDIRLFYPNIQHSTIHPNVVLGYKALLSALIIPKSFERESRFRTKMFLEKLAVPQGLPLGHSLSSILAPAMLIPLWMRIKQQFNVPFIVYMDDVLFFAKSHNQAQYIYENLSFHLEEDYKLQLNLEKTISGRFSNTAFSYCGWHFAGGYARVAEKKVGAFKERFSQKIKNSRKKDIRAFIKNCNRLIDGFGNHYKYGNVSRQFEILDKWIRRQLRAVLKNKYPSMNASNRTLSTLGLHSLSLLFRKTHKNKAIKQQKIAPESDNLWSVKLSHYSDMQEAQLNQLERIANQLGMLTGLVGKQLIELQKIANI